MAGAPPPARPLAWLAVYDRSWLVPDCLAGVTLAAYAVPVALAYATLAGLAPEVGIYGYMLGGLGYALLGSSRHLAIGPTSAISLLTGASIAPMAAGDPVRFAQVAALAALLVALLAAVAWALRLSTLTSFISDTILLGFKAGAGLTIAVTQLPSALGVAGGGDHFVERVATLGRQLGDANPVVRGRHARRASCSCSSVTAGCRDDRWRSASLRFDRRERRSSGSKHEGSRPSAPSRRACQSSRCPASARAMSTA